MIRTLEKQFEPEKASRLRLLIERLHKLSYQPGASRYYGLELASCIEAGALLGALIVGSSLLELHVRGLIINYSFTALRTTSPKIINLESSLEENRSIGFDKLVDSLVLVELFNKDDGELVKKLYKNVRIPLLHGLPRRFVHQHLEPFMEELWSYLGKEVISSHELEDTIEDHAVEYLEEIVGIIERNRF